LDDDAMHQIAQGENFSSLKALMVSVNDIGKPGVEAIAQSENFPALEYLDILNNPCPPISHEPRVDRGTLVGYGPSPKFGRALVKKYGPKKWLLRKDKDFLSIDSFGHVV